MKRDDLLNNISPPAYSGNSCFFDSAFMALFGTPDKWINKNIIFAQINNKFLLQYNNTLHTKCYNGDVIYKVLHKMNIKNITQSNFQQLCIHYLKQITYLKKDIKRDLLFKYVREKYLPPLKKRNEWVNKFRRMDNEAEKYIKTKIQKSILDMIISMRNGTGGTILKSFKETILRNGCLPLNNIELKQTLLTNHEQTSITMIRFIFDLFYVPPIKFFETKVYCNDINDMSESKMVSSNTLSYPILLIDVHEEFDENDVNLDQKDIPTTNQDTKIICINKIKKTDSRPYDDEFDDENDGTILGLDLLINKNGIDKPSDNTSTSTHTSASNDIFEFDSNSDNDDESYNHINIHENSPSKSTSCKSTRKLSDIIKLGKIEIYESDVQTYECNNKKYKILKKTTKIMDTEFLIVELNRCYFPSYSTKKLTDTEIIPEEIIYLGRNLYLKSIVCYFGLSSNKEIPITTQDGGHYVTYLRGFVNGKCKWYFYNDIVENGGKVDFKEVGDFDTLMNDKIVRKKSVVYVYTTDNGNTNVCPEYIQEIRDMGIYI